MYLETVATSKRYPFLNGGGEMGELTRRYDWSKTIIGMPDQWSHTLRTTVGIILNSRFPMFLWWGPELIQFYNDAYRPSMGNEGKHPGALGQKGEDTWAEIWPAIKPLIDGVMDGGESVWMENQLIPIYRNGQLEDVYWTFSYSAVPDDDGNVAGVLVTCTETTTAVAGLKYLEEKEARFRALIEEAPVATCLFTGREMKVEIANEIMLGFWGKGHSVFGLPLVEGVPELKGQAFPGILDNVFTTGKTYEAKAAPANLVVNGVLSTYYFDFTYKPLFNAAGEVYGIMDMAIDVTQQVLARKSLEEAEATLRGVIELAGLATWSYHIQDETFSYSPRFMDWLGFAEDRKGVEEAYNPLPAEYRESVMAAIAAAIAPGASGIYDNEHPIINRLTGKLRIIHAQARVSYDAAGMPFMLNGTAHDITIQRRQQAALEAEVQERTEQLAAAIEALSVTNEELEESNRQLVHSNNELAQYAYIASHDLQEPLRKIRIFSDILNTQDSLAADNKPIVQKIMRSAERMSLLILDLLEFSRLLKSETLIRPVQLAEIMHEVVNDFELTIAEKEAIIEIAPLPVIEAVSLQMNQLFFNLVSNALKFSSPGTAPHISIAAKVLSLEEAGKYVDKPLPFCNYYHITFADNGIGFEAKFAEHIFEVFKRLHGHDIYPGSGIGLALCRRIVNNHHGVMYAESETGKGTTFHIVLPDKQVE